MPRQRLCCGLANTLRWGGDAVTATIARLAHSTPPELRFTATDFNSYATRSTAEGAAQRKHGSMSVSTAPGLGAMRRSHVLGPAVLVIQ